MTRLHLLFNRYTPDINLDTSFSIRDSQSTQPQITGTHNHASLRRIRTSLPIVPSTINLPGHTPIHHSRFTIRLTTTITPSLQHRVQYLFHPLPFERLQRLVISIHTRSVIIKTVTLHPVKGGCINLFALLYCHHFDHSR